MKSLLALLLVSCSAMREPDAADHYLAAMSLCRDYQFAPAEQRTRNQDIACRNLKRVCIDALQPELHAPIPAYGNRIVDAGPDGSAGAGGSSN